MKNYLSEKNIAAILFIMVLVIFSFAHEYSKKRDHHYNVSAPVINADNISASVIIEKGNNVSSAKQ
jgi:hypothetical protein